MKILKQVVVAVSLTVVGFAANANLVTNGDFEAGSTGWSLTVSIGPTWGVGGSRAANTGCIGQGCVSTLGSGAFIEQTLTTLPGQSYNLSFWVGEAGGPTSEMSVFWDGILVADIVNPANNTLDFVTNPGMVQFTFNNLLATGAATSLEIHGRQVTGAISFDNVSVERANAAPEPASLALMALGLAGLAGVRRPKALG